MAKENLNKKLIEFDSDFSPHHPTNIEAARQRGLTYDSQKQAYVDENRCLIRDQYSQPF